MFGFVPPVAWKIRMLLSAFCAVGIPLGNMMLFIVRERVHRFFRLNLAAPQDALRPGPARRTPNIGTAPTTQRQACDAE
jgi:hypothetical protein